MRRFGTVWSLVAVAALACAANAFAATPATPAAPAAPAASAAKHATGIVQSYDAKTNTVEVKVGAKMEKFTLDASTAITEKGAASAASKLQKGQKITVEWMSKNGQMVASKLDIKGGGA